MINKKYYCWIIIEDNVATWAYFNGEWDNDKIIVINLEPFKGYLEGDGESESPGIVDNRITP